MSGATISLKSLRGKMSSIKENMSSIKEMHAQSKPKNLHVKEDQVIQITLFQVL